MRDYVIVTDSSCDLPASMANELGLTVVPLTVLQGGTSYRNYLDERELGNHDFYEALRQGKDASTSAVNVDEFTRAFEPILQAGKDLLYLGFSSGLSATYQAGALAAADLSERYPESNILTIDTLCASMGQGLMVYLAVQEKKAGKRMDEVAHFVQDTRLSLVHMVTVDDLKHLKRGGRISAAAAIVGGALNIKPIIHVNNEGRLINIDKIRGRKNAMRACIDVMLKRGTNLAEQVIFLSHGDCLEEAEQMADMIRTLTPVREIVISPIGPVIGAHAGPGTLALFFLGTER